MDENIDFEIKATHLGESKGIHRVKVDIPALGLYIVAMSVRRSIKYPDTWWVQPPAHPPHFLKDFNFDHKMPLWQQLEQACIYAVESFIQLNIPDDLSDEEIKKAFDNLDI